jgi:uncharacterized protein (TIGR02099 family)
LNILPHFGRTLRLAGLSGLVATALALGVIRLWLIPQAARYRAELADAISARLHLPVQIGALAAHMQGFEPVLTLKDVRLLDPANGQPVLGFRRLRIRLDLPRTLWSGQPALRNLSLEGSRLIVRRDADGRLGLVGLQGGDTQPAWLFEQGRIALSDIELGWRDDRVGEQPRWLGQAALALVNDGDRLRLSADLALARELGKRLTVAIDARGDPLRAETLHGRVYLSGQSLKPAAFEQVAPLPMRARAGSADFEVWGDWREGRLRRLAGRAGLERPILAHQGPGGQESTLTLKELAGTFHWRTTPEGWRLDAKRLRVALFDRATKAFDLSLAQERAASEGEPTLRAAASRLSLDDLRVVLDALPLLGENIRADLRALAPHGELRDLKAVYAPSASERRWGLCTTFDGLGFHPLRGWPGGSGWTGSVCGNDRGGSLRLASRGGTLNLPSVWPNAPRIDALDGTVYWQCDQDGRSLSTEDLTLTAPGLKLAARGRADWPSAGGSAPFVHARVGLRDVQAAMLRDYLPLTAMPRPSATWFTQAFVAGSIPRADLLLHGWLGDYPFASGQGVFQAQARVEGLELSFNPHWPPLREGKGEVRVQGRGMVIDADGGRLGQGRVRQAHAEMDDFVTGDWLAIHGEVEAAVPDALAYLAQSPLARIPERLGTVTQTEGDAVISLDLRVPITASRRTDVKARGVARLNDAALNLPAFGIRVSRILGDLHFDNEGLHARGVRATWLGEPIEIEVDRRDDDIWVDARGEVTVKALAQAFPNRLWSWAKGRTAYHLALAIPESMDAKSQPVRIGLNADLVGLALDLPEPLGKNEHARRDLRLDLSLQAGGKSHLQIGYGTEGKARFALDDDYRITGGDLALGTPLPAARKAGGMRLSVDLTELNLSAWAALWGSAGAPASRPALDSFDLSIDRCLWNGRDFGHLDMRGGKVGETWSGDLDSAYGKGRFELVAPEFAQSRLALTLDTLKWPKVGTSEANAEETNIDPTRLPALRIHSKQFLWQGNPLGALRLEADRWTQGLNIHKLELLTENHQLQLKGRWMNIGTGAETALDGRLEVKDLGRLATDLGFGKEIRDTPSRAQFHLKWPGGPHRFSAARVTGEVDLKLGKGGLPHVEPGLGRILGMLNLDNLSRRIRLDFSDLFGKGLAYDGMVGRFTLDQGQARTDSFVIDALAANIFFDGRAGLTTKDLDMRVAVVPHASVALPIAGTLAGGPAVGVAVLLAQRLVGDHVDSLSSSHYSVTGTWDDPKVSNRPGYMPMDMLHRAWTGLKDLSGFGEPEGEPQR